MLLPLIALGSAALALILTARKVCRYPADEPCSDFTEEERTCPFGCGCIGQRRC